MQAIYADVMISMSEFKKNPAAVLRRAQGRPVAVLNHNKVDFYLLTPALLESLLTEVAPAPMSGELLFTAEALLAVPETLALEQLQARLETLADDLMVELNLRAED